MSSLNFKELKQHCWRRWGWGSRCIHRRSPQTSSPQPQLGWDPNGNPIFPLTTLSRVSPPSNLSLTYSYNQALHTQCTEETAVIGCVFSQFHTPLPRKCCLHHCLCLWKKHHSPSQGRCFWPMVSGEKLLLLPSIEKTPVSITHIPHTCTRVCTHICSHAHHTKIFSVVIIT